jgi:hypothetical protein
MSRFAPCLFLPLVLAFAGCDQIAQLDGSKAREADGVAVGSACRQAGRAIEDCFTMNPDAPKASVFAGWKEMNDYMVANKLETVTPTVPRPDAKDKGKDARDDGHGAEAKKAEAPAARGAVAPAAASGAGVATIPATPAAPGVPAVPATVNIPGLNTNTAAATSSAGTAPAASPAAPAATPVAAAAPAGAAPASVAPGSISVGGQSIPISLPGAPAAGAVAASPIAAAVPTKPGLPPAHH